MASRAARCSQDVRALAVAQKLVAPEFISTTRKEVECRNLDVYDVLLERGRIRAMVLQVRDYWKDRRRGYTRLTKEYFLLKRSGRKLECLPLESATCAKRAKATTAIGQLSQHYLGGKPVKCATPRVEVRTGFKVLARNGDGTLASVFDDSLYEMNAWRREPAKPDHGGGFYLYFDKDEALRAAAQGRVFVQAWAEGKDSVLCAVEAAGNTVRYKDGKVAASRLRVLEVLQSVAHETPTSE